MKHTVLVVYASRHGGNRGIAERISTILRGEGLNSRAASVRDKPDPTTADALVVGSGVYFGNWLSEGKRWLRGNAKALRERPVWLFSSGPVGPPSAESKKDALLPRSIAELEAWVKPRGHEIFAGAFDPNDGPKSIGERVMRWMPASRDLLPAGDYREWSAIDAWARSIARDLKQGGGTKR
jgi:menaquinone-dependent protoporphyrinogen oxidase